MLPSKSLVDDISDRCQHLDAKICKKISSLSSVFDPSKELTELDDLNKKILEGRAELDYLDKRENELKNSMERWQQIYDRLLDFENTVLRPRFTNPPTSHTTRSEKDESHDLESLVSEIEVLSTKISKYQKATGINISKTAGSLRISLLEDDSNTVACSVVGKNIKMFPLNEDEKLLNACQNFNKSGDISSFFTEFKNSSKSLVI